MAKTIKIKKGLDIPLEGMATGTPVADCGTELFAIVPDDFPGYTWKVSVRPGDKVTCGAPLLFAKETPELQLVSPVSGTVEEVHRGERRKIEYVSVRRDGEEGCFRFENPADKSNLLSNLKKSGLYALMRQRPFDIVPVDDSPRDIFVTAFDSAPLAPSLTDDKVMKYLEAGLEALSTLTAGKIYLGIRKGSGITSRVAEVVEFQGPHPAGNVGVQIEAISPVNKGETVWALDAVTAARIGRFVKEGFVDMSATVAVTGEGVSNPKIVSTTIGANLATLLKGHLRDDEGKLRIISGNVLTGHKEEKEGWLRYPYRQITVIPEGDEADEFMGWASMNPKKYSVKKTFPAFLLGLRKPYPFDARIKGGHRAMILSGEYDKVFPFDIYPEYLIKAILAKDIERMEQLGIYEVAPEDFALPEFVDTSKIELQKIVREGLDYLRKETM